jgi:riboflavin transporter
MNGFQNKDAMESRPGRSKARWIAKTGILAAVAVVLMYLEFSLPFIPEFLKFDFSEIAVLLASFSMGPLTGILVELIKNLLHLPVSHTGGVGELANFLMGVSFVGTAGLIYRLMKRRAGAYIGMAAGTIVMTLVACALNYWIMLPFYMNLFSMDINVLVNMSAKAGNTLVTDMKSLIVFVFIPFNIFKGLAVSLIVGIIYKRISPLLHK